MPPEMMKLGLQIVGLPNQGKSKLMENMWRQSVLGLCGTRRASFFIDPHGTSHEANLNWFVSHGLDRIMPLVVLDATDPSFSFRLNPLRRAPNIDPEVPATATTNAILKAAWRGQDPSSMPQIRETLKITCYTLSEFHLPLLAAEDLLDIEDGAGLQGYAAEHSENGAVRKFWRMVKSHHRRERDGVLGGARRRFNELILPDRVRQTFSEAHNVVDFRALMDSGAAVLINVSHSKEKLSEDAATFIGCLILADIFLSSMGRPDDALTALVFVDEAHRFATEDTARMFTEARKFKCHPILAHQTYGQLEECTPFIKSSIMSARNKIFFGGLPPDDAEEAARFAFRGQLDFEQPKHLYDKPVVVGQEIDWLASESESRGTAIAKGTNWNRGGAKALTASTTITSTDAVSEGDVISEAHTDLASKNSSGSAASSENHTDTQDADGNPAGSADGSGNSRSNDNGASSGTADTSGRSHTTIHTHTDGIADTIGTTDTKNWGTGGSTTKTDNQSTTRGRSQTLRSVFETLPTQPYSLPELLHLGSVSIAQLDQGQAIVKIGRRPAAQISTLRIKDGRAQPRHIERTKAKLAAQGPFIVPIAATPEPAERKPLSLVPRIEKPPEPAPLAPALKDDGWS